MTVYVDDSRLPATVPIGHGGHGFGRGADALSPTGEAEPEPDH